MDYLKNLPLYCQILGAISTYILTGTLINLFLTKIRYINVERAYCWIDWIDCCDSDSEKNVLVMINLIFWLWPLWILVMLLSVSFRILSIFSVFLRLFRFLLYLPGVFFAKIFLKRGFCDINSCTCVICSPKTDSSPLSSFPVGALRCDLCEQMKTDVSHYEGIKADHGGYVGLPSGSYCARCVRRYIGIKVEEV